MITPSDGVIEIVCSECGSVLERGQDQHSCPGCGWRGDRCDCGEIMTWDPQARGTTCGGLDLVGALVCRCGASMLSLRSRAAGAVDWRIAKSGHSIDAGGIRLRAERADRAEVAALMERLVRLPELEAENEVLRRELARRGRS